MCDDYFEGDDFMEYEPLDDGLPGDEHFQDDIPGAAESDEHYGLDWKDIAFFGALADELAKERRRRRQIKREFEDDEEKKRNGE